MAKLLQRCGLSALGPATLALALGILLALSLGDRAAAARLIQQGPKLVGTGAVGSTAAQQAQSVALSADGNTAIVGGPDDNTNVGAAWVFARDSNGVWTQQGPKLVGTGAAGLFVHQGFSIALSADGNTAILGGPGDGGTGAAWVFTRGNGVWTQQQKLFGTGAVGNAAQGWSVTLSADGNTAIVGGPFDNNFAGAAWVFTRSNGMWTQLGQKLVGTGAVGSAEQGVSVALSADGNTVIVGGDGDNNLTGAAWVFVRGNGMWTQLQKLVGPSVGQTEQGHSVALSGDGSTAIVGGPGDNTNAGAAWVFLRGSAMFSFSQNLVATGAVGTALRGTSVALSGDGNTAVLGGPGDNGAAGAVWVFTRKSPGVIIPPFTQLGQKLVGTGAVGAARQGSSVALSGDGNTVIVGGQADNTNIGAAWVFFQNTAATHDFNGDGTSDIAWRQSGGSTAVWLMNGAQVSQSGGFGTVPTNWQLVGQRDFDGDHNYDWLWRDGSTGSVAMWFLNGLQVVQSGGLGAVPTNWIIAGTSDFNADGKGDLLWYDTSTGTVAIWLMNGLQILTTGSLGAVPLNWSIAGTDGKGTIVWRDGSTGTVAIWVVSGFQVVQSAGLGAVPSNWSIVGVGDFDGNGSTDILWRDSATGTVAVWLMNGLQVLQTGGLGVVPGNWSVAETGDFDGDGKSDILWRDTTGGTAAIWFMNGLQVTSSAGVGAVGLDWTIQGLNAD